MNRQTIILPSRLGITLLLSLGLGAVGLVSTASPARAASSISASASNGTVGVAQTVSATVSSSTSSSPTGTVTFTANGQSIGSEPVGGTAGTKAQVSWTPAASGSTVVQAKFVASGGETVFDSDTVIVATVDTATSITSPGSSAASTKITLSATVLSNKGQYVPTGNVTFSLTNGTVLGTVAVDGGGKASIAYTTPTTTGTVSVLATYAGDANANTSKSATDSVKVTAQASTVSLTVPQTNYVNTAVALVAKITPSSASGTVDFLIDNKFIGTAKVSNGSATVAWVPSTIGTFTLTAKYSGGSGVNSGTSTNKVTVVAQLKTDQITVDPDGSAGAWVPGTVTTLANGADVSLGVRSASGQDVKLSIAGPCSLNGTVLHVNGVGGTCTLTASTAGGNGYAPVTVKYTVQTGTGSQTARIAAPPSGSYSRGSKLRLSRLTAVTNVNQPVRWKVTKGRANCKVVASGAFYKLKLVKRGTCTVRATAPAISNQWAAFSTTRFYRVR